MMLPALTSELDTQGFVHMCGDLMRISGKDFDTVLVSQCAAILKFCIKHTPAASRAGITERALKPFRKAATGIEQYTTRKGSLRFGFPGGETLSFSKRSGHEGHISFLDTSTFKGGSKRPVTLVGGKAWHDMTNFRWSDERWEKFQSLLAQAQALKQMSAKRLGGSQELATALASRGLAKHSWYQVAEAIGQAAEMNVPQWVKDAKPQDGNTYQNGTATVALGIAAAYIEMRNDYPSVVRMDGQTLINYAIKSRVKDFERAVEKGVFNDLKTRAERYPGLFVKHA